MVKDNKFIAFTGRSTEGESFTKLAYYEPKLNDIRTKPALSSNTYLYGQQLTQPQADALNKGLETKITIEKTKKGALTYMVSYSPKAERFITKSLEKTMVKEVEPEKTVALGAGIKKKQTGNAISM